VAAEHVAPLVFFGTHEPALQKLPLTHWLSVVQVMGQLADEPLHMYGAHAGVPVLPAGEFVHVPSLPAALQESQAPEQALLQHTPSTQLPLVHWLLAEHTAPLDILGTHAPALQKLPLAHWLSRVHSVGQLADEPSHT